MSDKSKIEDLVDKELLRKVEAMKKEAGDKQIYQLGNKIVRTWGKDHNIGGKHANIKYLFEDICIQEHVGLYIFYKGENVFSGDRQWTGEYDKKGKGIYEDLIFVYKPGLWYNKLLELEQKLEEEEEEKKKLEEKEALRRNFGI